MEDYTDRPLPLRWVPAEYHVRRSIAGSLCQREGIQRDWDASVRSTTCNEKGWYADGSTMQECIQRQTTATRQMRERSAEDSVPAVRRRRSPRCWPFSLSCPSC